MTEPTRLPKAAWMVVGLLWFVALLNYFDRQLITTMGRPIEEQLHITDARFGLFSSVFLWVYGACSPLAGYIADRVGRRPVILASLAVWSSATLLTGFVRSFEEMLLVRALMGVSEAFYIPAAVALIVDYHRGSTRSLATGLHLSGAYAGSVLGGLGGWIAEDFGWRAGFQTFGAIGVIYALALSVFLKNPPVEEEKKSITLPRQPNAPPPVPPANGFRALLTTKSFVLLLVANALVGAAFWTIKNWLPLFFNAELRLDLTRAGIFGAMTFNAAAFAGMLIASTLSDRWSQSNPRARMFVPALGFCIAAPCFFAVGLSHVLPIILLVIVVVGMSQGCLDANLMPALCTLAVSRHRATGYGLLNFVGTTVGGLMTYLGGWLKDARVPFSTTFQIASILILLAGLLLFTVKPKPSLTVFSHGEIP